jgi:hypothetical protein
MILIIKISINSENHMMLVNDNKDLNGIFSFLYIKLIRYE